MSQLLGIDIGGTQIKLGRFSPAGELLKQWTRETADRPVPGIPPFAETARAMLADAGAPDAPLGITSPGVPAPDGRSIAYQPGKMFGLERFDWPDFLKPRAVAPILNDAHAALLGETWRGAAAGCKNVILLTLGTGVGGAILSDGHLLNGAIGRAGHIGHISLADTTPLSIFGTPGALEPAIGNYSVAQRSGGRFNSTQQLVEAHLAGDAAASAVWLKSIRDLARALTSYINCLDPEIIIIGGGIANSGAALFDPLRKFMDELEWRPGGHQVRILPAALGEWAGTYGAAWNAMQHFGAAPRGGVS